MNNVFSRRKALLSIPFKMVVNTALTGVSSSDQFKIPFTGTSDCTIFWGDGNTDKHTTGSITHTYSSSGIYTIEIYNYFYGFEFNDSDDSFKVTDITQWGNNIWGEFVFRNVNCSDFSATDTPILTNNPSMRNCFANCDTLDADVTGWDVSNVTDMRGLFFNADSFSGDGLSTWDVSNVTLFLGFLENSTGLSTANYDAVLIAWDALGTMAYSGTLDFGGSKYTSGGAAETARTNLIAEWGAITDGGAA